MQFTIYEKNGEIGILKTAHTSDGKTYLAWVEWADHEENPEESRGFNLYMQLLDTDGKPLWGEHGFEVEDQINDSWCADYSLVVTPEGDAIISWEDARGTENDIIHQRHNSVLYKINQQQEMLWGETGIVLDYSKYEFPAILFQIDSNTYAKLIRKDDDNIRYDIVRLNSDGSFATAPKELPACLVPSEGEDFIAIYSGTQGTVAMRYNPVLEQQWFKPTVVSEYIYSGYTLEPYVCSPDGNGGVVVTFPRMEGLRHIPIVQHVSADGEATFGPSADVVTREDCSNEYNVLGVNPEEQTILCMYQFSGNDLALGGQLFDFFGERLFGDGGILFCEKPKEGGYGFGPIGVEPLKGNDWLLIYTDELEYMNANLYFAVFDVTSKEFKKLIKALPQSTGIVSPQYFLEGNTVTFLYQTADTSGSQLMSIQCDLDKAAGIDQVKTETHIQMEQVQYFDLQGRQLNGPTKGLNIIRDSNGKVSKIMK